MSGLTEDIKLSDHASRLHNQMISNDDKNKLYTQQDIQQFIGMNSTLGEIMLIVQELVDRNLLKLVKQNNELKFQAVDITEAVKKSSMSSEESLVYSYIEASGREGIWSKTIKARTNLHQHVVSKCLKSLESQRYVKSVKSVKFPTRKIYMLYNLQPSIEVTGGPWFTEGELDVEFINSLLTIVWRYIAENTFPDGFNTGNKTQEQVHYAPTVSNGSTTQEILDFISLAQVANVELNTKDIRSLCEVLVYDDKLERIEHDYYKVTLQSLLQLGKMTTSTRATTEETEDKNSNNKSIYDDDSQDFCVYDYFRGIAPSNNDKEAVYFDEWTL
ncbi:similar to Saccharomyces cerevisiae YNR003C RPC34 RNA polymerase III subunit C34 [Maudiozyma saulgeensis]|uniref:DNA-directed RNA polymerase III subunit RPC6 n=1 Tax=Maudiozyma saulgeensis TaxID=1789683 RepID=A0A1X7R1D3_9SACH|nr:similar to Saccharomyces cerevisiae YNR003C RPC34 RNA polymerase III subunit C34 [Kazachstania saulgeensis]